MTLQKGSVDKKIRDAINGLGGSDGVQSTEITDATTVGKAVLTAASQSAARTAIGAGTGNGTGNVTMASAPASATAAGSVNQIAFDATHIYVCIATNTWVRATLATW